MYYVRATGGNRHAGGTSKWLKIRSLKQISETQCEISAIIGGQEKFTIVNPKNRVEHLEFAEGWPGLKPIGFLTILKKWKKLNGSQ